MELLKIYSEALLNFEAYARRLDFNVGICTFMARLVDEGTISDKDLVAVIRDMRTHKPENGSNENGFWWFRDEEGLEKRLQFLSDRVDENSN